MRLPYIFVILGTIFVSIMYIYAYHGTAKLEEKITNDLTLIYTNHFSFTLFENDSIGDINSSIEKLGTHISFALYANDSISNFKVRQIRDEKPKKLKRPKSFEYLERLDSIPLLADCNNIIRDSTLYIERWDTLAQPNFWREIMNMRNDTCLVNLASSRIILDRIPTTKWQSWSDTVRKAYRDSIKFANGIEKWEKILVTSGKRYYYDFEKALPLVSRGVDIFAKLGTDPWYAQAIALIESPGQSRVSPVGASGCFQLMPEVAIESGLVVNDSIDEREDFDKAAVAASFFISTRCIPQTRRILRKYDIPFEENETWFKLIVLHVYHAGAGNVDGAIAQITPAVSGKELIKELWQTEYQGFKNASQNYSQLALASLLQFDYLLLNGLQAHCPKNDVLLTDASETLEVSQSPSP